jgi:hypothetical protein
MNKEELEKMFNERFIVNQNIGNWNFVNINKQCFDFIFETIIPEVLKSVMPNYVISWIQEEFDMHSPIIKKKVKDLYWITL